MNSTANNKSHAFIPGQHVWTIFTDSVCKNVVAEVSDQYVRLKGRRTAWIQPHQAFPSERDARLALAAKFRERAAALLLAAGELENG